MKTNHPLLLAATFIISQFLFIMPAHAAIKCWTNNEGIRECGNKVPPEYAQKGHQELSRQGMVKNEQARAKTSEELAEEARLATIEAEKARQAEEQARQDKILLDTFSKVKDLEDTRDAKLAAIQSTIGLAKKRMEKIQADLDKRIKAAATEERSGKKPNQALLKDIESLRRQVKNNELFIADKRKEQEQIKADYASDIDRFKELKGLAKAD